MEPDMLSQLILTVSIALLAVSLLLWLLNKQNKGKVPLPPGPYGLPLLGYLPFLGPNLHHMFKELARIYGPIYKLSIGRKKYVVISSPSLVKEVVRDQDISFANRNPTIAATIFSFGANDIACAAYGPEWRMLRRIFVREMLSSENLDAFYSHRRNEMEKSISYVYGKIGKNVDIGDLTFSTVINMISSMFWEGTFEGEKGTNVNAEFLEAVSLLTDILGKPNISDFFPKLAWFDIQGVAKETKMVTGRLEKIFDYVINERIRRSKEEVDREVEKKQRRNFLQFLLEFTDKETGKSVSREQIKALFMDICIGGTDTVTTTVKWVMTELLLHPEITSKIQQELTEVVGVDNVVEDFHLNKLTYLQAVVKETLRMHPASPILLPRSAIQSRTVAGYLIPKGTRVLLNVYAIHRDPEFWDNPLEFQPTRFLNADKKFDYSGNNFHYLPFGSGRRMCAGIPLGERMLTYVLATFLHMFEWKTPDGTEPDTREKFGLVLQKLTPLVAIPVPRLSNLELYG